MSKQRIDVHTHLIPPFWAEALKTHGGDPSGWASPEWSPEQAIRFMDDQEIAISVLSLTAPGVEGWKGADRIAMTKRVNDYGAELTQNKPDRFGYFATLPLPDVEASLAEIERCFESLRVDGVTLHSNYEDIYLSDPRFDAVWGELEKRAATIFVHPTRPPMPVLPGLPSPLVDYPSDTTRCAVDLVFKGHRRRFPSTKVILSHGGGYLPFAATRFAELGASISNGRSSADFLADIRSFYFDTALVAPSGLPSLLGTVEIGHIVFGTDYPYASEAVSKLIDSHFDNSSALGAEKKKLINKGAGTLFLRFR